MFQILNTCPYLFENMHKYYDDDYVPTFEDLVHGRQRTTGVNKIKFVIHPDTETDYEEIYEIFDVGGCKNERRKWMHFFDNSDVVLFVVNLGGFNKLLWRDNHTNCLREDIGLFRSFLIGCI